MYYITEKGSHIYSGDSDWELVPGEVWEDVTAIYKERLTPLRLRDDERVTWIDGLHHGPAFIIERKRTRS